MNRSAYIAAALVLAASTVQGNPLDRDARPGDTMIQDSAGGAINPRTGKYYHPSGPRGVIDPQTGTFYPKSGQGFVDPKTGHYYPAPD